MNRLLLLLICGTIGLLGRAQQLDETTRDRLQEYFSNYATPVANIGPTSLKSIELDHEQHRLDIYPEKNFAYQPFTKEAVDGIYQSVKQALPGPVCYYDITIYADGKPIEELIPNAQRKRGKDKERLWNGIGHKGDAWVRNLSRPYRITEGLEGRHIAVHQSHGRYFKNEEGVWKWQRPRLFCSTEDLFTQSFVVPYILPMLERAGAVVYSARERDWQRHEVIVDNDTRTPGSLYYENKNRRSRWTTSEAKGFAHIKPIYQDGDNPFRDGTARVVKTASKKRRKTFAEWIPNIPEEGRYAVYVSYQTLPNSVTDTRYTVFHKGGATEFAVNQRMGGGTWVYLGTFEFDKGSNDYGMVVLSNESKQKGVVSADAVRFGGGMGNVGRSSEANPAVTVSGLPRYLEGARYNALWRGMPENVYSTKGGLNDYADDINTRSFELNYLSGGSVYNPRQEGLSVPFELSVSVHSDAGYSREDNFIGSLGIYTTAFNEGKLGTPVSRYASRDLNDMVLTGLKRDLSATLGINWVQRGMWNSNYSESRLPQVPSMILETLSHQNFADMKLGHDPRFKLVFGRSVYKSILKYIATMHGESYIVQPLPVSHFAVQLDPKKQVAQLTWQPQHDPLEPTASPQGYVVYTRIGFGGFDNGIVVKDNSYRKELESGVTYSFKVTALNKGGESFPSETLSACLAKKSVGTVLIVNGFNRLSGPETIETADLQGFDLRKDIGVPYLRTPEYCGEQTGFDRSGIGMETEGGLGYSSDELEGKLIAGNTFDYPFIHGKAIQAAGGYSFTSCSRAAVESGMVHPADYAVVDYLLGAEKQPFNERAQRWMTAYCRQGGKLLISGTYVNDEQATNFTSTLLKYQSDGSMSHSASDEVTGTGIRFHIHRQPNEKSYAVPAPACILPTDGAFSAFAYTDGNRGAGTAYKGTDYSVFVLGFPLESITERADREHIMRGILQYFSK